MRILITGATGFVGLSLLKKLEKEDFTIATINRSPFAWNTNIQQYIGDLTQFNFVEESVLDFKPTHVFHLAAVKVRSSSVKDISNSLSTNLIGTLNLYQSLMGVSSLESVVVLGTTDEYGESSPPFMEDLKGLPVTAYGFSKMCATNLSDFFYRNFNLPVTVLRPTIAYGPSQGVEMFIPSLIQTLMNNKDYLMTKGEQLRDFIYISDLIDAMLLVSEANNYRGQIFNIGSGEVVKIKNVAELVANKLKKQSLLKIGAIEYREREMMDYQTSTEKAKLNLNWTPRVTLSEGLERTIEYFSKNNG